MLISTPWWTNFVSTQNLTQSPSQTTWKCFAICLLSPISSRGENLPPTLASFCQRWMKGTASTILYSYVKEKLLCKCALWRSSTGRFGWKIPFLAVLRMDFVGFAVLGYIDKLTPKGACMSKETFAERECKGSVKERKFCTWRSNASWMAPFRDPLAVPLDQRLQVGKGGGGHHVGVVVGVDGRRCCVEDVAPLCFRASRNSRSQWPIWGVHSPLPHKKLPFVWSWCNPAWVTYGKDCLLRWITCVRR